MILSVFTFTIGMVLTLAAFHFPHGRVTVNSIEEFDRYKKTLGNLQSVKIKNR